jgi:DNA-binding transcriptional MerR regulator
MEKYTITQIAELLSLKVHTIRYWEKNVSLLSSVERDEYGKRLYNRNDLYMLTRLKYYIEENQYTLKGATEALLHELSYNTDNSNAKRKKDILDIMNRLQIQRNKLQEAQDVLKKNVPIENSSSYDGENV